MTEDFKKAASQEGICPVCEDEKTLDVGTRRETLQVRKEPVEYEARVSRCTACGEYFCGLEEEEENFQSAYREYRRRHNLMQPEEIKAVRERYGLGQRALSRVLGWGEVTIHRYESGSVQDEAHNDTLLLIEDPDNFARLFELNKESLPASVVRRVEKKLSLLRQEKMEGSLEQMLETQFMRAGDDIQSGYRSFDFDRFESAILFFCKQVSRLYRTKLYRLLWYFDFLTYRNQLRSATGAVYLNLNSGPAPAEIDFYLASFMRDGVLETREETDEKADAIVEDIIALEEPDLSLFEEAELECLELVAERFGDMAAGELSERTASEKACRETKPGAVISYEWAPEMKLTF